MIGLLMLLATAAFVLLLVPRLLFPLHQIGGTWLDRSVVGAVALSAVTVATMAVLGMFGFLETFSIAAVWLAVWWVAKGRRRHRHGLERTAHRFFIFSDTAEHKGIRGAVGMLVRRSDPARRHRPPSVVMALAALALLLVGSWIRFGHALASIEFPHRESYLTLTALKTLGQGELFANGLELQGAVMWLSMLERFYPLDAYTFVRFALPLVAALGLVTLYWALSRATGSRGAAILSTAVFAFFVGHPALAVRWPHEIGSPRSGLAVAFLLVGITCASRFVATRRQADLWSAGAALFVAASCDTAALPVATVGYLAVVLVGLAAPSGPSSVGSLLGVSVGAALLAQAPLLYGTMLGLRPAPSYAPPVVTTPGQIPGLDSPLAVVALLGAVLAVVVGLALIRRSPQTAVPLASLGTAAAGGLMLVHLALPGLDPGVQPLAARAVGVATAAGLGLGLGALLAVPSTAWSAARSPFGRRALDAVALACALGLVVGLWPAYAVSARTTEPSGYPQATEVALRIAEEEERLTFTVVGVTEQYQELLTIGFFVEAWVFARDIAYSDARDPSYEIPIPTDRIYLFVEKIPFRGVEEAPTGPAEEFYRNHPNRARVMQRFLGWSEVYRKHHRDMEIYWEDDVLRVYRVDRRVNVDQADRSAAFKDYTWRPGRLFTSDTDVTAERVTPKEEQP